MNNEGSRHGNGSKKEKLKRVGTCNKAVQPNHLLLQKKWRSPFSTFMKKNRDGDMD